MRSKKNTTSIKYMMKKYFSLIVAVAIGFHAIAQSLPDNVWVKYNSATTQRNKSLLLWNYLQSKLIEDSMKSILELQKRFREKHDETGVDFIRLAIATAITRNGDYTTSLTMSLPVLASFEKRKDTTGIICALRRISNCYEFALNFEQAVIWAKKTLPYAIALKDEIELSNSYNDIGATYAKANMPDSGLVYAQQAVNIDMRMNNEDNLPFSLSTLAENYITNKNFDLALPFLRKALLIAPKENPWSVAWTELDLAQAFRGLKSYDSAVYYAQHSNEISLRNSIKETLLKSYEVIYRVYEETHRADSANKYFRLTAVTKDSLYAIEKINVSQNINFQVQLRQQEIESEKEKAEEERKTNIQFAAIAIGLISFIILFLSLSQTIIVREKFIKFFGILGLLAVFEFINLYIHPYLSRITNNSPVFMLVILIVIGALLIPLHHRLEKWITKIMVEKNQRVRLTAAKKTIEQLGKNNN